MKFKGDMHDSLKHVLMLCYHSYLSNEVYIAYLNQVNAGAVYEFVEH